MSTVHIILGVGFLTLCLQFIPGELYAQQGTLLSPYAEALQQQSAQTGGLVTCSGWQDCNFCSLGEMVNNIINWLFGFLTIVAVLVLAAAGFKLVTSGGDTTARDWAKQRFTYVIIGFLLMFASWLIVDTILRGLTGSEQGMAFWGSFDSSSCGFMVTPTNRSYGEYDVRYDAESGDDSNHDHDHTLPAHPGDTGTNCGVDEASLVNIPGQGGHRATAAVAERFVSMQNALARKGISLNVTSSYRSDARQTEIWDGCARCQAEGTVARPCSRGGGGSRHSSGLALDLVSSGSDSDIINACRAAGAGFTMTYERSNHVHCDWR